MSFHYFPEIPHVDTIAQTPPVTNYNKEREGSLTSIGVRFRYMTQGLANGGN